MQKHTNKQILQLVLTLIFAVFFIGETQAFAAANLNAFTPKQQWFFSVPFNVAVDSSGNVYVADGVSAQIQKRDSQGTILAKWGSSGSGNGQFTTHTGIAVDSSGNIYVSEIGNKRIQKFNSSGAFVTKWGSSGSGNGQFDLPYDIAVDSSGNVYVVDAGNNKVQKFSSSGVFLTAWGSSGSGDGQFNSPRGIAVDSLGNVYIADGNNNRIQKFNSSGTFLAKWGSSGTADGQFKTPRDVAVDSLGNVYVVNSVDGRVQKFDSSGAFLGKWGSYGTGDGQFASAASIVVDNWDNVYVVDSPTHRIQRFDASGNLLVKWESSGTIDGLFNKPIDVDVDSQGNVYVADANNSRIQKFDSSGTFLTKWGSIGSGDGQFGTDMQGVAVDSQGNVYVADNSNHRIQKFNSTGSFLTKWGSYGSGDGQFGSIRGVAADGLGNVYVVEMGRIQRFDSDGNFITKWGSFGSGEGQFSAGDITTDTQGNVYIADTNNSRIQKFDSTGNLLMKWGSYGSGDGQFYLIDGVTVDSQGNVYVADTYNNRIQKFDSQGNFLAKWGSEGNGAGQLKKPYGVAAGSTGKVYVADTENHRIQVLLSNDAGLTSVLAQAINAGPEAGTKTAPKTASINVTNTTASMAAGDIIAFGAEATVTFYGTDDSFTVQEPGSVNLTSGVATTVYIMVTAQDMTRVYYAVTINSAEPPVYSINVSESSSYTFDGQTEGYGAVAPHTVMVSNTGNQAIGALSVTLSGTGADCFMLSGTSIDSIAESGSDSFTIKPKEGLAAGTYTATVTVSGSNGISASFDVNFTVNPAVVAITSADITGIVAPAVGTVPAVVGSLTAGHASYIVTGLTWQDGNGSPATLTAGGKFKAGSTYQAVVELTATAGYKFQPLTPTVNTGTAGASGVSGGDVPGNKLIFTITFTATEAQSVTAIAVETQPAKLSYMAGEALDLAGLVATLTYNDESTLDIALADFAANGITVNPANGTVMSVSAHNGAPVILTCNSHTATIGNLAVNEAPTYAITLSETGIRTFTEQTVGYTPVVPITVTVTRTGTGNITNLAAALSGADSDRFTLGALEAVTLDSATTSATFTIKPKDALAPNDYTAVVTVTADNGVSQSFTIRFMVNAPSAPTIQSAAAGDGHVNITWSSVPGATGYKIYGSTVSGSYSTTPLATVSDSVYSYDATGLSNGITYYFVIRAVNGDVESASSNEVSAVPRTVPGVPTGVTAVPGNGQATISFTAPSDDGGSPITEYIVTSNPGGITATGTGTPITVTGLSNGTTYIFTVEAVNTAGKSIDSAVSNAVIPVAPPSEEDTNQPSVPTPSNTGVDVLVNGKPENAGTATTTTKGSQTVTTITVDAQKLQQKLEAEGNHAIVTIPANTKADVVIGELNAQMVKNMESKEAVLEIRTETAAYTIPAQQINIDAVSQKIGKEVDLQDIKVQVAIVKSPEETVKVLENSAQKGSFNVVAPPVDFSIRGIYEDHVVEVSKFKAYVERMVAIPEGVDPNRITTGIAMELDGTVRHIPTQVTIINGRYYAKINSLTNSTYSVVWHPVEFQDAAGHWAKEAINDIGSRMVISGVGGNTFEPDRDITRAEFAAIVVRALGLKPGVGTNSFTDVQDSDWYSGYIKTAFEYKIISGYDAENFGPEDSITREQAMAMIARAMKITPLKVELAEGEMQKLLGAFSDREKTEAYAKDSIAFCIKTGVVQGKNGNMLAPKENITRAEVAVIARRLLQKANLI